MDKIRIIIAEDNLIFSSVLKEFLESTNNFEVVGIANDGMEVLKLIQEINVDLLILDVVMPCLDGIGVLEKINEMEIRPVKRIIVLSTIGQDNITRAALALGADYYIIKPFDMNELVKRIRQIFNFYQVQGGREFKSIEYIQPKKVEGLELSEQIANILSEIGIQDNIKGYIYLKDAIRIMYMNMDGTIPIVTRDVYPQIAEKYNVLPKNIERGIRKAIKATFNTEIGKLTNAEFLTIIADKLRMKNK